MTQLATSPIGYGIPDFASGAFSDARRREELRLEIEATIRRFEPRFLSVRVNLIDAQDRLETTLRLRIEAVLHAEPAPESVTYDTLVDPMTDDSIVVCARQCGVSVPCSAMPIKVGAHVYAARSGIDVFGQPSPAMTDKTLR